MSARNGVNNPFILAPKGNECSTLDFTNQGIKKIDIIPNASPTSIIYDKNAITQIPNLHQYGDLQQLSLAENRLTDISGVSKLVNLTVLNLPNNNISKIEGLRTLNKLGWLNLSGNQIKVIDNLQGNIQLQHLDLSDNHITTLGDLAHLLHLRTLLLHGNAITTLRTAPQHLTKGLKILSLAKNQLSDLNEVGYLSGHDQLQQLSIMDNPCVLMTGNLPGFDYRPFIVNWCLNLEILDGYLVTKKEGLKAEWLYSQGKGRHFRPGQQLQLLQYLATVCPLSAGSELEREEDARLARVLQQQRLHQEELTTVKGVIPELVQSHAGEPGPGRKSPSPRSVSTRAASGLRGSREESQLKGNHHSPSGIPVLGSQYKGSPGRAWSGVAGTDASGSRPQVDPSHQRPNRQDMQLQDVSSSESESQSLLDCETRYLPLHSELSMSPLNPFNLPGERPKTAPAATDKPQTTSSRVTSQPEAARPSTAHPDSQRHKSRYEQYDSRPIKAAAPGRQSRIAANFGSALVTQSEEIQSDIVKPTPSDLQPQAHTRKRSQSPLTRAIEMLDLESDSDSKLSDGNNTALELKLLKALLASRKSKKESRRSQDPRDIGRSQDPNSDVQSSVSASMSSSPYRSQYTPEKYTSPSRRDLEKVVANHRANAALHPVNARNDGCRDTSPQTGCTENDPKFKEKTRAATKLQALWRGFMARSKDPSILRVRQEIRAKRAEEHITHLRVELEKQKGLYEQEKTLRAMQLEALKHLWKQVQSLQDWKREVVSSQEQFSHPPFINYMSQEARSSVEETQQFLESLSKACGESLPLAGLVPPASLGALIGSSSSPRGPQLCAGSPQTTMTGPTGSVPHPSHSADVNASQLSVGTVQTSQKEVELESACKNLQQQVSQLQEVLSSMSNVVFSGGPIAAHKENTVAESIRLSMDFDDDSLAEYSPKSQSQKGSFKVTAAVSSSTAVRKVPATGVPTAPEKLRAQSHNVNNVVLFWQPSVILNAQDQPTNKPVMGYRIYVNGFPKGMVAGAQLKALIEGLNLENTYRITVRGISAIGESNDSNMVVISPDSDSDDSHSPRPPGNDGDDNDPKPPKPGKGDNGRGDPPNKPSSNYKDTNEKSPKSDKGGTSPSASPGGTNSLQNDSSYRLSPKTHGPMKARRPGLGGVDIPPAFVKDKSPSGDSGYWTSPTNTVGKPTKASSSPSRQVQEAVQEEEEDTKHNRRSALFERLEKLEKKLKSPMRSRDFGEEIKSSNPDDNTARRSIANILDQKRTAKTIDKLLPKDIIPSKGYALNFKASPNSSTIDLDTKKSEDFKDKKLDLNASSKIPVFVRKDGSKPSSPIGTKPDFEATYTLSSSTTVRDSLDKSNPNADTQASVREKKPDTERTKERRISWETDKTKERKYSTGSSSGRSSRKSSLSRRPSDAGSKHSGNESSSNNTSPANTKELNIDVDSDKGVSAVLVPKPPDGPTSPRKPTIGRRNSFKNKKESSSDNKSSSDINTDTSKTVSDQKSSKSVAEQLKVSVDNKPDSSASSKEQSQSAKENESVKCQVSCHLESSNSNNDDDPRGRRESRSKKEKSERRASSLGAIMNRLNNTPNKSEKVIEKPPLSKGLVAREHTPERRVSRRRTKSEQGNITSSEDEADSSGSNRSSSGKTEKDGTYGVHAVVRRPSRKEKDGTTPKVKTAFNHKRASSDLSNLQALPDRPESPAPKDRKTPNVPLQAPSSPRVRRSSSFSKAQGKLQNSNAILRQCISLETLKAAKNRDGNGQRIRHNSTPSAGGDGPSDNPKPDKPQTTERKKPTTSGRKEPVIGHRRSHSHGTAHDINVETEQEVAQPRKSTQIHRRPSLKDDRLLTAQREKVEQARARSPTDTTDPPVKYSPKLGAKQTETSPKQRKIKLGNKAADLFAKLQMRLSSNKM